MENKSAILVATERLFCLGRDCPDDESIEGYWELLGSLRKAIDHLENFRQRGSTSSTCPQDRDSAIGTPDTSIIDTANTGEYAQVPMRCRSGSVSRRCRIDVRRAP